MSLMDGGERAAVMGSADAGEGFDTPRLHVRPLGAADEAIYARLYTDPAVMRDIAVPLSAEAARRSFRVACQQAARDGSPARRWIVSEHAGMECARPHHACLGHACPECACLEHARATPIGLLGLVPDRGAADRAELGLMLLADRQRRGLAVEALAAMTDRVFSPAGIGGPALGVLWTRHAPGNLAAVGLMRRLRFLRQPSGNADPPEWRWQMTRDRWRVRA